MPSRRTKPYHLYLVFLKLPGKRSARASCTCGKPANGLVSLVTAGAVPSFAAGVGAGAASPGGIVKAGGLDDSPGSTVLFGCGGAWTVSFGGGSCPYANEPKLNANPTANVNVDTRLVNLTMASLPHANAGSCPEFEQVSTRTSRGCASFNLLRRISEFAGRPRSCASRET